MACTLSPLALYVLVAMYRSSCQELAVLCSPSNCAALLMLSDRTRRLAETKTPAETERWLNAVGELQRWGAIEDALETGVFFHLTPTGAFTADEARKWANAPSG